MKSLVVEDDFASRRLMQKLLSKYGEVDVAVNGKEAVSAFIAAEKEGEPYALVLLDIMMPEMDGHETLRRFREYEEKSGKSGLAGVNVVMVTALDDYENIMKSFRNQCEAYMVKPVTPEKLAKHLSELHLI